MFRKLAMIAAFLMLSMPIGGGLRVSAGSIPLPGVGGLHLNPQAQCWFHPWQLILVSACVMVLALTCARRLR